MSAPARLAEPPRGFWLFLARLPIWFYRARLGRLLGNRFLLLIHTGRKTGLPRRTVLEVIRYEPATGTYTVVSGHGEKSDWFRNICRNPEVTVQAGFRVFAGIAERLSAQEAEREFRDYARRHPWAFRAAAYFLHYPVEDTERSFPELARVVPVIALRPQK